jgi:hypothetical protein
MRSQILTYLTANLTGSIKPSQELPWAEGNNPLYLKNMKRVYLDEPNTEVDELVPTFESDVLQKITTIRGFLAVDAKNRNADLDTALATLALAKDVNTITDSFRKEFDYTTSIDGAVIVYEFEYRFYTLA